MTKATPSANGMLEIRDGTWLETGTMNSNPFFQTYDVKCDEGENDDTSFSVFFPDGSLFYTIADTIGSHPIEHLCADDLYVGTWTGSQPCADSVTTIDLI